VDLLQEFMIKN